MTSRRTVLLSESHRKHAKASYKPLVSYISSELPASVPEQRPVLPAIEEVADVQTVGTRDLYESPSDPQVREALKELADYLENQSGGVEAAFVTQVRRLLSLARLPYNPYPGFGRRARQAAERFPMFAEHSNKILQTLANPTTGTRFAWLVTPADPGPGDGGKVWGLASRIGAIHPGLAARYHWLINDQQPPSVTLNQDSAIDYTTQAMPALVGTSVLHESFYPQPHDIIIRVEYLITGAEEQKALELFAESIINDTKRLDSESSHVVIGIPLPDGQESNKWRTWTVKEITDNEEDFTAIVIRRTKQKETISSKCIFHLEEHSDLYFGGRKEYVLNFLNVREGTHEEGKLKSFTQLPLLTLHDGVFLNILHADCYTACFARPMEDEPSSANTGQPRHNKLSKTQVDGFRLGSNLHLEPFAPNVVQPIIEMLQRSLAASDPYIGIFDALPNLLTLGLMERAAFGDELFVEVYRILHSTSARLHRLQLLNEMLRQLVNKFEDGDETEIIMRVFIQYRQGILDLFTNTLQERSHDLSEAGKIIVVRLDKLVVLPGHSTSIPLTKKTVREFQRLYGYCATLQHHLVEDALSHCPRIKEVLNGIRQAFTEDVPRSETPIRPRPPSPPSNRFRPRPKMGEGVETFLHGKENESLKKHDKQVVNVAANLETESAPQSMRKEAVLLKYVVDTRLDEVWPAYLTDLLSSNTLPPNPFPWLVTGFRQAAARMHLCQENPEKLVKQLLPDAARVEDQECHVFHLPGADAHGCKSALSLVDTSVYHQLVSLCQPFILQNFIQRKGPYSVAMSYALGSHTPLYGRMMPYVLDVHLEEHCYMRGPDGGALEAMHIYSKIVYDHLLSLHEMKEHPAAGVYFGGDDSPWKFSEHDRISVTKSLEKHWGQKKDVFVKFYTLMDWRYVAVKKFLKFHYINVAETEYQEYFPADPSAYYQTVFFEAEKAVFHYQYGGPGMRGNPFFGANVKAACKVIDQRIVEAKDNHDWINVHRWLLTRNLITQGSSHVVEAWRMLHGVGGQFEYLITLVTGLTDLTSYCMAESEGDGGSNSTKVGAVTLKALGRMMLAFKTKTSEVCTSQVAMTSASVAEAVKDKIRSITEKMEETNELLLKPTQTCIDTLEEVVGMLEVLRDITSYDVHSISPEAQTMVKAIEAQLGRPVSTMSDTLKLDY